MSILVIAEQTEGELNAQTLNAIAAAKEIGGDIHVLVAGQNCGAAAEAAAPPSSRAALSWTGRRMTRLLPGRSWGIRDDFGLLQPVDQAPKLFYQFNLDVVD